MQSVFSFFLLVVLAPSTYAFGSGAVNAVYLSEIALSSAQSLVELNELISEARKTSESLQKINEFTEKAHQEVMRAKRIEDWARDLNELQETNVTGLDSLNRAIRGLKDRRMTIDELLTFSDSEKIVDKIDDRKSEVRKRQAKRRESTYQSENVVGNDSLKGAMNRTADNTASVAKETAIINQNLEDIKKNQNQIVDYLRKIHEESLYSNSDITNDFISKKERSKLETSR